MASRPKILLLGLELHWPAPPRLPRALQAAGFEVGVACHARAFMAQTKFRDHFFRLPDKNHGDGILAGLKTIFSAWPPDLLLPMDDWSALFLTRVHEQLSAARNAEGLVELLQRSLGNPAAVRESLSKRRTVEIARALGLRVPAGRTIESARDIREFAREHSFPVVLKLSYASGGKGVAVCGNENEISAALASLRPEKSLKGRVEFFRERFRGRMMKAAWLPGDTTITVNQFIAGRCATSLAAVRNGRTLAALTAEVKHTYMDDQGPASVIRIVRNEEMCHASETMLKHWGLTGLIGFDFMLDAAGRAWLIECNPRPTPLAHLGARVGEDLCAALYQDLISAPRLQRNAAPKELLVAHFPQESWRDSASGYFTSAYHDVPWDDPELLACLKNHSAPTREGR